jgi:hypothetical protein
MGISQIEERADMITQQPKNYDIETRDHFTAGRIPP